MTTKRITPEMVKRAYQKTGLQPIRGCITNRPERPCCCGIGVLAAVRGIDHIEERYAFADRMFGNSYRHGFVMGFDGGDYDSDDVDSRQRYRDGFNDGRKCATAVFTTEK